MRCALALTGGVAKGAFHAGVLRSFAEAQIVPSVIVGSSAGALNGALCSKLIAEDAFTPQNIQEQLIQKWIHEPSLNRLWGKGKIKDKSLRSLFGEVRFSVFLLRRLLGTLAKQSLPSLRDILTLEFTSVFSDQVVKELVDDFLPPPQAIKKAIIFSAAVTDLIGEVEIYEGQPIISYGGYHSFHLHPGLSHSELQQMFQEIRTVIQASSCFPGMFPPVSIGKNGTQNYFVDGGLTKNAPFGRAIKLDPEVKTIFLVSSMPITKPAFETIGNLRTMIGQVYKIILNKDLSNDYRKIIQLNQRIELLQRLLKRGSKGEILEHDETNLAILKVAGLKDVDDFLSKRVVEIIIIEPEKVLEGDPFAGIYWRDRERLVRDYTEFGYQAGMRVLKNYALDRT